MRKYKVALREDEREVLRALISRGKHKSQKIINALILLGCDEGEFQTERSVNKEISRVLGISMRRIDRVKKRFVEEGLEVALNGKRKRRKYTRKVDKYFETRLAAIMREDPPEGFSRWSLRLLADKVVELDFIDNVSHETIRRVMKKAASEIRDRKRPAPYSEY
ncbi:MAG: hypothetical protein DRG82_13800 [Deltaproteobacteria bacterium]|nr:MAG: hypothetical protein DRG82_13800 [Deltaproteobacteria bacterium]